MLFANQLPATVKLTLAAMAFATVLGVSLGVLAAIYHNTWVDFTAMLVALAGISIAWVCFTSWAREIVAVQPRDKVTMATD